MGQPSDRRLLVRWAFLGMGYFLLFGRFYAYRIVAFFADGWGQALFGTGPSGVRLTRAIAGLYMLAASVLCFVANSGLRRNRAWGRWAGMAACIVSLPWFPFMTLLGAAGVYGLSTLGSSTAAAADSVFGLDPAAARRSKDYWISKTQSRIQPVVAGAVSIAGLVSLSFWQIWAIRTGLPRMPGGLAFWFWFSVFLLGNVVVHESGHAVAAWSLYYRVRVVSMGPLTFWRDSSGVHSKFDWRRLFFSGGFTGSVATRQENARWNHVAVVAAGPAASLLAGLVFTAMTLLARGTGWQSWWWAFAMNATIGVTGTVLNLIPVGYSDGSMLLHLILWTTPGRLLIEHQFAAVDVAKAKQRHELADFGGEVEIHRAMLADAENAGEANAMSIAACRQRLGYALYSADDFTAAECELSRAAACEAELAANPALGDNVRNGLVAVRARRLRIVEMRQAYTIAAEVLKRRKLNRSQAGRGLTCAMLAQLHVYAGAWDAAAAEASEGLRCLPLTPENLISYASLFIFQAEALLQTGRMDPGLTAASSAAETLRAEVMPERLRNLAACELGALGEAMWRAGQPAWAIDYLRESIAGLERGGITAAAAARRIRLCGILRSLGRYTEAVKSLPPEDGLAPYLRRNLLAETIELALLAEAGPVALEHSQALIRLWEAETVDCAVELACANSMLARAHLLCGQSAEAETHARSALDTLKPSGHPEAARCLLTIAGGRHRDVALGSDRRSPHDHRIRRPAAGSRKGGTARRDEGAGSGRGFRDGGGGRGVIPAGAPDQSLHNIRYRNL